MAIELTVDLGRPLRTSQVVNSLLPCLGELLNTSSAHEVRLQELRQGFRNSPDADVELGADGAWIVELIGSEESVYIAKVAVDDDMQPEGHRTFAHIMTGGTRTALEIATVAATAVVIARHGSNYIDDPAQFFVPMTRSGVEDFVERVRLRKPSQDTRDAAEHFLENLNKSGYAT